MKKDDILKSCIILIAHLLLFASIFGQSDQDSTSITSFRKGRNFVGLSGSIGSSSIDNNQGIFYTDNNINKYSFDIRLGKFVANKNLVGLVFNTMRDHSTDYVDSEKEILSLGPFYRLYISNSPNIGLFFQTSVLYTYYVEHSEGLSGFLFIEEELRGHGISGTAGIGFAYVINDIVAFEVGFDYMFSGFKGEIVDLRNGSKNDITFRLHNYQFSFGFNLLFGRLKKE